MNQLSRRAMNANVASDLAENGNGYCIVYKYISCLSYSSQHSSTSISYNPAAACLVRVPCDEEDAAREEGGRAEGTKRGKRARRKTSAWQGELATYVGCVM